MRLSRPLVLAALFTAAVGCTGAIGDSPANNSDHPDGGKPSGGVGGKTGSGSGSGGNSGSGTGGRGSGSGAGGSDTSLPGTGAAFLATAVGFANDRLAGTLGASVVVRPGDRKAMGAAFDEAIADLQYGSIAINAWTGVNFFVPGLAWGAYPGGTLENVGSGIGVVHNARLLADPERSIVTGPFRPFPRSVFTGELSLAPRPPWFVTARTEDVTASRMTRFAVKPSWRRIPGIIAAAFRG